MNLCEKHLFKLNENIKRILDEIGRNDESSEEFIHDTKKLITHIAENSFCEGFEAARIQYALKCVNLITDIFKEEKINENQ